MRLRCETRHQLRRIRRNTRHDAGRAGVASMAVQINGQSAARAIGIGVRLTGRAVVMGMVAEMRGLRSLLVAAIGRRHGPPRLEREKAHEEDGEQPAHGRGL